MRIATTLLLSGILAAAIGCGGSTSTPTSGAARPREGGMPGPPITPPTSSGTVATKVSSPATSSGTVATKASPSTGAPTAPTTVGTKK